MKAYKELLAEHKAAVDFALRFASFFAPCEAEKILGEWPNRARLTLERATRRAEKALRAK